MINVLISMTKNNIIYTILQSSNILLIILVLLCITAPVQGAIDQRGPLINIAAGERQVLNGINCPGFYYSTSSGTYYESLDLYFSEDGFIDTENAVYTSKISYGSTAFFGKKYRVLEEGLLSKSLVSYGSRDLQQNNDFYLGNGYKLVLGGVNGDSVLLELQKDHLPVTTESVEEGSKFNFKTKIEGTEYVILTGTVKKVLDGKEPVVRLKSVNQYSDLPLRINTGDRYGKFEVTEVTDKKIELKNRVPIRLQPGDYVTILDNLIDFRVADDVYQACSYNMTKNTIKAYKIRGTSQTVKRSNSSSCIWTAASFGMFFYDPEYNLSTERLELQLEAGNDWIPAKGLVYESVPVKVSYKNPEMMDYRENCFYEGYSVLGWDGEKYASLGSDQGIVNILMDEDEKLLHPNEELDLKEGYTLKITDMDPEKVYLTLFRNNIPVYSSVISPGKSADLGTHTFLYTRKLNGVEVPIFSTYVDSVIVGGQLSAVNLKYLLHFSDSPLDVNNGMKFGELTVVETYPKLRLENKHDINSGSEISVTEEIRIGLFEKKKSGDRYVTFYPFMNRVEDVESVLPSVSSWSVPVLTIEEYLLPI